MQQIIFMVANILSLMSIKRAFQCITNLLISFLALHTDHKLLHLEDQKTVTVIVAGNAMGQQVLPFFVFPGKCFVDGLLEGASTGATGTMHDSGWSNTEILPGIYRSIFLFFLVRNAKYQVGFLSKCKNDLILPTYQSKSPKKKR